LFILRIEDAEHTGGSGGGGGAEWDEVLKNPRINRGSSSFFSSWFKARRIVTGSVAWQLF